MTFFKSVTLPNKTSSQSHCPGPDKTPVEAEIYNVSYVDSGMLSAQDMATETLADPVLRKVLVNIKDGLPDKV